MSLSREFQLSTYDYGLPERLIAQEPLTERDRCRLLVVDRAHGKLHHASFQDIGAFLSPRSLFVVNNSRVIPARLKGIKKDTGARVEVFLLERLRPGNRYRVLMKPMRRIRTGQTIEFPPTDVRAVVEDKEKRIVRFNRRDITSWLNEQGQMPLPPYIRREATPMDRETYQTIYARHRGSVASPTAGLHFTRPLIQRLKREGHEFASVTLHINYATFRPVEVEDIRDHVMHEERYSISQNQAHRIARARRAGRPIVAVGTTACRTLETWTQTGRSQGRTALFIRPGFRFQMVNSLITNFHQPRSSLLMLVSALASGTLIQKAYHEAIEKQYRFLSYGDAMLIR